MCSIFCMHTCTPVTPITTPLWWVQVSVIFLTSTQAVGGGRELMRFCVGPESQGSGAKALERWAPWPAAHRMIYSVWSTCKHFLTYLGCCRRRPAGLFDIAHVTDIFDLKESPIIGRLACLGSPDKWFCPWEKGQGTAKELHRNGEQDGGGQSNLDDPRLAWEKTINKEINFWQNSQTVPQRN